MIKSEYCKTTVLRAHAVREKPDAGGVLINFDAVYKDVIKLAVEAAGLEPLRADEESGGGIIHKPMFERLVLCPYAVADLTTANANVFYELGVRHAVRPASTVLLMPGRHECHSTCSPTGVVV
jgi:hypothetical protein